METHYNQNLESLKREAIYHVQEMLNKISS